MMHSHTSHESGVTPSLTRGRRIIGSWAIFLIVLLLTEHVIVPAMYSALPVRWKQWDRVTVRDEALETLPPQDVLILGDSTAALSVSPDVFESVTGLKAYNFSTSADRSTVTDLYFLLRYLEKHPAPRAVIDVRSIHSWSRGTGGYELIHQSMPHAGLAKILLRRDVITTPEYLWLLLDIAVPSLVYRERFALVRSALMSPEMRWTNEDMYAVTKGFKGFEPFDPARHNVHLQMDERNLDALRQIHDGTGKPNQDPLVMPLVDELCDLASANNIRLYLTMGPNAHAVFADQNVASAIGGVFAQVQTLFADRKNCTLLPEAWLMGDPYLSDITHPNATGAIVFSVKLAEEFLRRENAAMIK